MSEKWEPVKLPTRAEQREIMDEFFATTHYRPEHDTPEGEMPPDADLEGDE